MLTLVIPHRRTLDSRALAAVIRFLIAGGVIAFPSETTYGLACDPRQAKAVARIFRIKGRDEGKPLQLIAGSMAHVRRLAVLSRGSRDLARTHWPGPLTLLLPLQKGCRLPRQVAPGRIIGIRVSSSDMVRQIALALGYPLAATSANRSGLPPAFSGKGVIRAFQGQAQTPDLLLDVGALPRRKPSTVARVHDDGTIEVLRPGGVRL